MASSSKPTRSPLNAAGEERPIFLLDFPTNDKLDALIALFEEGNFYQLRRDVKALDSSQLSPEVQAAAQELFNRTEPDPAIKWLLLMCFALFAIIVGSVYLK